MQFFAVFLLELGTDVLGLSIYLVSFILLLLVELSDNVAKVHG